jgi:hypothetical protein
LARRPTNVATVAYANKLARIAWAIMMHGNRYNPALAFATLDPKNILNPGKVL